MFYIAEVRDIKDPLKSGRVKVRVYNYQDDEQYIKDDHLPWAIPLQPVTSAATGRVGIVPVGLEVGSRVIVGYHMDDSLQQYPIIFGSFSRGALPSA
jgi:hypothetical protein